MAQTSSSALLNTFTNVIANETLQLLQGNLVLSSFVGTPQTNQTTFTKGNTLDIVLDPVFTVSDARVDDTERTYQTPTQNKITLTLDYFKEVPARWTNLDQVIADPALFAAKYGRNTAITLAAQIEKDIFSVALNDPAVPAGNEIGGDNVAMNAKALRKIRQKFVEMNLPIMDSDIIVVVSPQQYSELLADSVITENQTRGDGLAIQTGRIGTAYGMTIIESNYLPTNDNLSSVSGGNANPVGVAMVRGMSVGFAVRALPSETMGVGTSASVSAGGYALRTRMWADPNVNQFKMTTDVLYGIKTVGYPSLVDGAVKYPVLPILGGVA